MQRFINFLRGRVTVQATGAYPERLINLCAAHAVAFWGLEWVDALTFRFTVAFRDWKKVKKLAEKAMCELSQPRMTGLPATALALRRRYAFLAGLALCAAALTLAPRFILAVEVEGNERVPTAVILSELRRLGVKPGAWAAGVDERAVANRALIALRELSFLSVNLSGSVAEVTVREAEEAPELAPNTPADIVSAATGIVLDVKLAAGQALVEEGDTVVEGDVLITGFMDLPEYTFSETDLGSYVVHAAGTVTARTWRTLRAVLPLTAQFKTYTGESAAFWSVNFPGGRLNFYENSGISYERYDRITETAQWDLPGGELFPLSLTKETVREYTLTPCELDQESAIAFLEDGLRRDLDRILQETNGECIRLDCTAAVADGVLTVTLLAECVEEIGVTVEREGETGFIPGTGAEGTEPAA